MSIQGKGNLSYKKQNVQKQNAPHTGVKNITFAHLFSNAGETTIPFDALVTPPDWSTSGLVNPTPQSLLSAQLQVFKNNVTVTSSARGLIQKSEYIVHANRIEFKNITSLANEYFEVEVADILITGNLIVDMQTIRVEGELQDTDTDFNMGYEFDVLNEEIIVFRDGIQMFRSDNNDSSGATGNYYYVDTDGNGRSSLLRFFEPSVGVEPVLIASTGGVVDNANVSTFQQIEHLAGQLDAIVPTVAALAGVPESNFRSGPNNVDLKTFGDKLLDLENTVNTSWVDNGTLTSKVTSFGGTDPTFTSVTLDKYYYKETADGDLRVRGELDKAAGGTDGTSSYEISLPLGYEFDTNFVSFETNNGATGTGRAPLRARSGLGSCFLCFNTTPGNESNASGLIVPTSATTFRLVAIFNRSIATNAAGFWGQSWYASSGDITITFDGILPVIKV